MITNGPWDEMTFPPEMLPVANGPADVVVCMGDCGNEPPCPLCVTICPGDDTGKIFDCKQ